MRCGRFGKARREWPNPPFLAVLCVIYLISGLSSFACTGTPAAHPGTITLRLGSRDAVEARGVLTRLLYSERLIGVDWHGRPQPWLATDWQWQDDERTGEKRALEIHLRRGVKFHDGTMLSAPLVASILWANCG